MVTYEMCHQARQRIFRREQSCSEFVNYSPSNARPDVIFSVHPRCTPRLKQRR
jgi:hypothetical protein